MIPRFIGLKIGTNHRGEKPPGLTEGIHTWLPCLHRRRNNGRSLLPRPFKHWVRLCTWWLTTASIPHARDDIHLFGHTFEDFVLKNRQLISGVIDFEKSILQQPTGDAKAPVPIVWLWDTNSTMEPIPPEIQTANRAC